MDAQDDEDAARRARDLATIRSHVAQLAEHFDTVQVFATRLEPGGDATATFQLGAGNWYARYGHIAEWMIVREDEFRRHAARRDEDN